MIPKPERRATTKRRQQQTTRQTTRQVYEAIWQRDQGRCRLTEALGMTWSIDREEMAHLKAKSLGGETTTVNCFLLARFWHTGKRSHHSKDITIRALTEAGCDGPLEFVVRERGGPTT